VIFCDLRCSHILMAIIIVLCCCILMWFGTIPRRLFGIYSTL